jgi:two-component system chemotaxis response regulator CheY
MAKKILLVDDAAFMRMMLKNILTEGGYEISGEAKNGVEAIAKYKELNPDLVTMDITMPEMDGIEAVKKIREFDNKAKIVMCSAMGQQAMVIESIQAGAKSFIVKPFAKDKVIDEIRKVIGE